MKDQLLDLKNVSPYALLTSFVVAIFLAVPELAPYADTVVSAVLVVAPVVVIWLERQKRKHERLAAASDTMEANLLKLIETVEYIRLIKHDAAIFYALPERHRQWINQIEDRVVNLATKIQGFRDFQELMEAILREERKGGESDAEAGGQAVQ